MATVTELQKKRDALRKSQVRDRAKIKNLRDAIAALVNAVGKRKNQIENLSKQIGKLQRQHPTDVSKAGLAFITRHEKEIPHTYNDAAGNCTCCVGHLLSTSYCSSSKTYTHDQCMKFLHSDAQVAVAAIKRGVTVDLNQNQFDALADFIFNVGTVNFASSTLRTLLNQKKYSGAADQFLRWIYDSNHVAEPGLKIRREDEKRLFLS